jgi:hypothetical protein
MARQVKSDLRGIAAVFAHPKRQRLKALDELERVGRAHAHANVTQKHNARADGCSLQSFPVFLSFWLTGSASGRPRALGVFTIEASVQFAADELVKGRLASSVCPLSGI